MPVFIVCRSRCSSRLVQMVEGVTGVSWNVSQALDGLTVEQTGRRCMQQHPRPWGTMECSQPAAWTTNRTLLVVPHVMAFPGRPTNSDTTLRRAAQPEGGAIRCRYCIAAHSRSAPASPDMRPTPLALSRMLTVLRLHPCHHPAYHSHDPLHTCPI